MDGNVAAVGEPAADVLLCPLWRWQRPAEDHLLERLLVGLGARGYDVLCLLARSPLRQRLEKSTATDGEGRRLPGRVRFHDPRSRLDGFRERLSGPPGRRRGRRDFERAREILAAQGVGLADEARADIAWTAAAEELWRRASDRLRYRLALVRCHWLPLGSAVAREALGAGTPVVTLQQGVVSHTIDLPVTADRYAAFGEASARVLAGADAAFGRLAGRSVTCGDYFRAGSLIDPVPAPTERSEGPSTLLLIDQSAGWASHYYGLAASEARLETALAVLLAGALDRMVVRPHPALGGAPRWRTLAETFPRKVSVSPPGRPLADDLADATVVAGFFSGALATAAAAGRPTFFFVPEGGFATPDLAPFVDFHVGCDELVARVVRMLRDPRAVQAEGARARAAARGYFEEGGACRFDDRFFDRLLAPLAAGGPAGRTTEAVGTPR